MKKPTKELILVKLGGSIITDKNKPYVFKPEIVKRLAREIKRSKVPVLIAHGGGSFPHTSAKKYGGVKGYKSLWGIAKVARDAMEINRLVMDILIDEKIPAVSFRPMSMIVADSEKPIATFFEPILETLKQGLTPVIYGDVILDKAHKSTIFSGEKALSLLAIFLLNKGLKISKIIEVGVTDGVYDEDGKTINEINNKNFKKIKRSLFRNKIDVTGGMEHKIEEALRISSLGISTVIINGTVRNYLLNALQGKGVLHTVISL